MSENGRSRDAVDSECMVSYEIYVPEVLGLTLFVLRCADIERSRRFYEALGLEFTSEQHGTRPRHYSTTIGATIVELYPRTKEEFGTLRFGLRVSDVKAALEAVRREGATVFSVSHDLTRPFALVVDPDGNKIELS